VGRHRQPARRTSRSSLSRPFAVGTALVAAFVTAQLFLPANAGISTAREVGVVRAAALVSVPASAAEAVPPALHLTTTPPALTAGTVATRVPKHSGKGRRVVYSLSKQRLWTITKAGHVQRSYLVSGRLSQPSPDHYRVFSKSRWTSSTVSAETMQYMIRFTHGARTGTPIGFHSIPVDYRGHPAQSVHDLGKPLSAGCIRERLRDAAYLWDFAHVGTRVVVIH
jgi:lipoprotein-anchoring transpeptidase ErfK/SrfK